MRWSLIAMAALMAAAAPAQAPPSAGVNGIHPEQHGPPTIAPPPVRVEAPPDVTVVAKHARRHRRWRTTAGHVGRCKRKFRTYNPRTNLYVARPGLRRRCVL